MSAREYGIAEQLVEAQLHLLSLEDFLARAVAGSIKRTEADILRYRYRIGAVSAIVETLTHIKQRQDERAHRYQAGGAT